MSPITPISSHHDFDPPPEYLRQGPTPVPPPPERKSGWAGTLAVLVSLVTLSAFAGGVWFAYEQGVRRGMDLAPPLVRADTSPTKIVPVEPGGMQVANQDKRVFETMTAAAPPPRVEQLLPPPETPMAPPAPEPRTLTAYAAPVVQAPIAVTTPNPVPPAAAAPVAATPSPAPTPAVVPVPDAPRPAEPAPLAEAAGVPVPPREALPETPAGAPLALLPPARPVNTPAATPAQPPAAATPAPRAAATPPAAAPAAGGYRIQLGAFTDQKVALDNWAALQRKHGTLLAGMTPNVSPATVNGKSYQRLQAGPLSTQAGATQLCATLKAAGTDCLVVRP